MVAGKGGENHKYQLFFTWRDKQSGKKRNTRLKNIDKWIKMS